MDGLSRIYDAQQQLQRAVESKSQTLSAKAILQVCKQLDEALEQLGFKRADYWSPDTPDWTPPSKRKA
jgi:hypothetical protein